MSHQKTSAISGDKPRAGSSAKRALEIINRDVKKELNNDYFDQFDKLLAVHSVGLSSAMQPNSDSVKKFSFKDFFNVGGEYQKDLADFIYWLVSANEREAYLCKACNIKFKQQVKSDHAELMKIFVYSDSKCQIAKKNPEWTKKCTTAWQRYCEKNGKTLVIEALSNQIKRESFHKRALSSGEMLLPTMDEQIGFSSLTNNFQETNAFNTMESFYAPEISAKDLASSSMSAVSPVFTPERQRMVRADTEELRSLRKQLSSTLDMDKENQDLLVVNNSLGGVDADRRVVDLQESFVKILASKEKDICQLKSQLSQVSSPNPTRTQLQQSNEGNDSIGKASEFLRAMISKLQEDLQVAKNCLVAEKAEKDKLSIELKKIKAEASDLQEKYTKSTNEWTILDKQTREVLKKYVDIQQITDAEMIALRRQLANLKKDNLILREQRQLKTDNSSSAEDSDESKIVDPSAGMADRVAGIAMFEEFYHETKEEAPPAASEEKKILESELNLIKANYNNLLSSSRANIERLRNSFTELTAQHRTTGNAARPITDVTLAADLARMEDEFKTMRDNYEKLYKLSQAEIQSLRSLSMQASDTYVSDLAAKDLRAEEMKKIYETDISVLKSKNFIALRSKKQLEKQLADNKLEQERMQKAAASEVRKLQKEMQASKEKSERELRRVQAKLEAEINLVNMERHQLKAEAMEYNEKALLEFRQRDLAFEDAKAVYETDLHIKTQALEEKISYLKNTVADLQNKLTEQASEIATLIQAQHLQEQQKFHEQPAAKSKSDDSDGISAQDTIFQDSPDEYIVPQGGYSSPQNASNEEDPDQTAVDPEAERVLNEEEDRALNDSTVTSLDLEAIYVKRSNRVAGDTPLSSDSKEYINPLPNAPKLSNNEGNDSSQYSITLKERKGIAVDAVSLASAMDCSDKETSSSADKVENLMSDAKLVKNRSKSDFNTIVSVSTTDSSVIFLNAVNGNQSSDPQSVLAATTTDSTSQDIIKQKELKLEIHLDHSIHSTSIDAPVDPIESNSSDSTTDNSNTLRKKSSRTMRQNYTKTLLKSRAMSSSSNSSSRNNRNEVIKGPGDADFYHFGSKDLLDENYSTTTDLKVQSSSHKRSSSSPVSPLAPLISADSMINRSNSMRDLIGSHHHPDNAIANAQTNIVEMRFEEAMQLYAENDRSASEENEQQSIGRQKTASSSQGTIPLFNKRQLTQPPPPQQTQQTQQKKKDVSDLRESDLFSDDNPLFARSRSSSYKRDNNITVHTTNKSSDSNSSGLKSSSLGKQASDTISSLTGPADSRSFSVDSSSIVLDAVPSTNNPGYSIQIPPRQVSSPVPEKTQISQQPKIVQQIVKALGSGAMRVFDGGKY